MFNSIRLNLRKLKNLAMSNLKFLDLNRVQGNTECSIESAINSSKRRHTILVVGNRAHAKEIGILPEIINNENINIFTIDDICSYEKFRGHKKGAIIFDPYAISILMSKFIAKNTDIECAFDFVSDKIEESTSALRNIIFKRVD